MQPYRPIKGKLKCILAKVQSQFAKLPVENKTNETLIGMVNAELRPLHLMCRTWEEFVYFTKHLKIGSKSLSNILRPARRLSPRLKSHYMFAVEDILLAVEFGVPFSLLEFVVDSNLQSAEHALIRNRSRRDSLYGKVEIVKHCQKLGVHIPFRKWK
jgi:hypothetical protein